SLTTVWPARTGCFPTTCWTRSTPSSRPARTWGAWTWPTTLRPSRTRCSGDGRSPIARPNNRPSLSGGSVLQIGQHGQHAAAAVRRLDNAQLGKHAAHVGLHGSARDDQLVADRVVGIALSHE